MARIEPFHLDRSHFTHVTHLTECPTDAMTDVKNARHVALRLRISCHHGCHASRLREHALYGLSHGDQTKLSPGNIREPFANMPFGYGIVLKSEVTPVVTTIKYLTNIGSTPQVLLE